MKTKVGGILNGIYSDSSVISVRRFKKGIINKTYDVKVDGKPVVLRIYPSDFWKVQKEKYLYSLISKKTDVPVPEVIESGKDYLLMSKVEGKELSVENKNLVRKAGEVLAKIHSIKFLDYGWIINKEIKPKFRNWVDFIRYDVKLKFKKIPKEYQHFRSMINGIIDDNESLLNVKSKPCLLHKDYHSSHIITNAREIEGIIDIEWAMSGHNELDIVKSCLWMFEGKPKLEKVFLDGYKKHGKISKKFNERRKLYKLLNLLSAFSLSYECKNRKWCIYNLKELEEAINEFQIKDL